MMECAVVQNTQVAELTLAPLLIEQSSNDLHAAIALRYKFNLHAFSGLNTIFIDSSKKRWIQCPVLLLRSSSDREGFERMVVPAQEEIPHQNEPPSSPSANSLQRH